VQLALVTSVKKKWRMRDKGNWEIINRKRKKWKEINKRTEMREWEEYFKELLGGGGRGGGGIRGKREKRKREIGKELNRKEVRKMIRNLKDERTMRNMRRGRWSDE